MNFVVIVTLALVGILILGALFAALFRTFSKAVVREQAAAEAEARGFNPALTYGYKIPLDADAQEQMKAARKEAARQAAALPRGANANIGRGNGQTRTAYQGAENDPISAAKIASIHTWEGLRVGASFSPAKTVTHAGAETAPATKSADDLVPGKDYEYIEITDEMSPAEKRKARIANAKAKSAAVKALKASAPAATAEQATTATAAPAAAPATAAPASVSEPVAGVDYEVIEITDDMGADEVRKARIANVKAKSAAMKAYKEALAASGGVAAAQPAPAVEPAVATESTAQAAGASPTPVAADIPPPDLIEIVDGMAPEEVRKARIHNAKAQAAYKKALKEAGIDPKSV